MNATKTRVPEAPADLEGKRSQWHRTAEAGDNDKFALSDFKRPPWLKWLK